MPHHSHRYTSLINWVAIFLCCCLSPFTFADVPDAGSEPSEEVSGQLNKQCDTYKGPVTTLPAIPPFTWKHTGLITLWFDDGWVTEYTNAFPLMEKYGMKGAVAIAIKFVCYPAFMTWDQLRTLQEKGWETTAHSVHHSCDLGYYTTQTIKDELLGSQKTIQEHGLRADQFVMPCGFSRAQIANMFANQYPPIVETAKQYFSSYRTTTSERENILPLPDPYNLKAFQILVSTTDKEIQDKINQAVKDKTWLILVFHQVDDTKRQFSFPPDKFEKILEMIKASGLPVVLPSQALSIK